MKRREFITLLGGGAVAWPMAARAQQSERKIGVLMAATEDDAESKARIAALRQGLREQGWTEGHNVRIEVRWALDDSNLMRRFATELVAMAPDVIIALSPQGLAAVQGETPSIPIVFVQVADPVGGGFVASLVKPGGNITGFTSFEHTISAKWLELIKEIVPHVVRVAIFRNPAKTSASEFLKGAMETAAPSSFNWRLWARSTSRRPNAHSTGSRGLEAWSSCRTRSLWSIASGSSRWRRSADCLPSIPTVISQRSAAW